MPSWSQADYDTFLSRRGLLPAELKPAVRPESLAAPSGKEKSPTRLRVSIISVRKRLLDPDNVAVKYTLDCLRYAGIIPDDRPQDITLEVAQRKCHPGEREHTEITVT